MPNHVRVLTVPDADRAELERRARSKGAPARVVERARIVLLAAGRLEDPPRPGGPRRVLTDEAIREILAATVTPPPESLQARGVTHWPGRRLADWLHQAEGISVSHDSITVLWRKFCLQPHRGLHVLRRPAAGRQGPRRRGPVPGTATVSS
jgi:hypothetical protein